MKRAKKKVEEVVVPDAPMIPAETNSQKIAALVSLQTTPGWALLLDVFTENIQYLERIIIDGFSTDGTRLTREQEDEVRFKIKLNKELINTPKGYIEALRSGPQDVINFDPYAAAGDMPKK